jgi:hypothetical protein
MRYKNRHLWVLTAFALIIVAHHLFGYIGHYGYDDIHYAELAQEFRNGSLDYSDHYSFRTPVIALTALSYSLFGISDTASSLPAMVISVFILIMVFNILRGQGTRTLVLGLGMTTLASWFLFYSDKLMPDIYVAFFVLTALYIIYHYKYRSKNKNPLIYSILLSLSLLTGFMAKGTIILVLPLLAYLFIIDMIFRRDVRFWIYSILSGVLFLLMYFMVTRWLTGDFLQRFEAISGNSYLNPCSYDQQPFSVLLGRITYGFFDLMVRQSLATGFIFIIPYLFIRKASGFFKCNDPLSFWLTASVILLLSSNFMSVSIHSYSPMCLDPRHYLFLIPVVSIPAAGILNEFIEGKRHRIILPAAAILVAGISFFTKGQTFWQLYLPLAVLISVYSFLRPGQVYQTVFLALFIAILSVSFFRNVAYAQEIRYLKQKDIFTEQILEPADDFVVITNEVQKRFAGYYAGFDSTGKTFFDYDEYRYDSTDNRKKLLFLNWYTRYLSGLEYNDLPYYAKHISPRNKLIFQDKELKIAVYEMIDITIPEETEKILLHSKNGFEGDADYWNQKSGNFTDEIRYEGQQAEKVAGYSSTFEYPLDSMDLEGTDQLLITVHLFANFNDRTESSLVISIENDEGVYVWNGLDINRYMKAYANWWPVKHEVTIDRKDLREHSIIKAYLWNKDQRTAYIDNFEVKIIGIGH